MALAKNLKNALNMLPHLAECAKNRTTITYSELGEHIGVPAFFLGQSLDILRDNLLPKHNLPRLDALVVNKNTKEAGEQFYEDGRGKMSDEDFKALLEVEREAVYAYPNWDKVVANLRSHYGANQL